METGFILLLVCVTYYITPARCYSLGPPLGSCKSMAPAGHLRAGVIPEDLGFTISAPNNYSPGETVKSK